MLQALLESQLSVELLGEHQLSGRLEEYPLLSCLSGNYLEPKFRDDLVAYVKAGGNLLLVGPRTAALFEAELGVALEGEPNSQPNYLARNGAFMPTKGFTQAVKLGPNAQAVGRLYLSNDLNSASQPAASVTKLGQGQMTATYFTFGQGYLGTRSVIGREFLNDLVRQLFPKPIVEVKGSADVDVVVNRSGGRLAVNLVNTAGPHDREPILESIPAVGPLAVTIRQPSKPAKVTLHPAGRPLAYEYRAGEIQLTLPRLEIHDIIVVE